MADAARARRLAGRIKQIVATGIDTQIKDPRLGMVTITDVRVTGDLHDATVFYTVSGTRPRHADSAQALESAVACCVRRSVARPGSGSPRRSPSCATPCPSPRGRSPICWQWRPRPMPGSGGARVRPPRGRTRPVPKAARRRRPAHRRPGRPGQLHRRSVTVAEQSSPISSGGVGLRGAGRRAAVRSRRHRRGRPSRRDAAGRAWASAGAVLALLTIVGTFVEYGTTGRAARWYGAGRPERGGERGRAGVLAGPRYRPAWWCSARAVRRAADRALAGGNDAGRARPPRRGSGSPLLGVPGVLLVLAGNGWMRGVQDTRSRCGSCCWPTGCPRSLRRCWSIRPGSG